MNYLGIDYGNKRIGLAKANSELKVATPLTTITNDGKVFENIREIVVREQIDDIVVGVPVSLDGKEYGFAKRVRGFGEKLRKHANIRVNFVNEALTTDKAAENNPKDLDASAAALILQDFLDQKSTG